MVHPRELAADQPEGRESLHHFSIAAMGFLVFGIIPAEAQDETEGWHIAVPLYLYGTGLEGQVGVNNHVADIDLSFGDLLDNLELGFMSGLQVRNGRWAITGDLMYTKLGATTNTIIPAKVEVKEWVVGGDLGYEIAKHFDVLGGVRYYSVENSVQFQGPFANRFNDKQTWADPVIGIRVHAPFSQSWGFWGRFDIGGFGAGSDLAWQIHGTVLWRFHRSVGLAFGYRVLAVDYKNEDAGFVYDVTKSGPVGGILFFF